MAVYSPGTSDVRTSSFSPRLRNILIVLLVAVKKKRSGFRGMAGSKILVPWTTFSPLRTRVTIRVRFQTGSNMFECSALGLCQPGDTDFRLVSGFSPMDLFPLWGGTIQLD
jgi:hypothetical protein